MTKRTKPNLDSDAKRALWMAYKLLLNLGKEKTTGPDTCQGDPEPAVNTGERQCDSQSTTVIATQQAGGQNE